MSESAIFYGAGKNAELNLDEWLARGITPTCFVDSDIKKHYSKFAGYDVLPLNEALTKYPNSLVYITLINKNLLSATNYLIKHGVQQARIRYFDSVEFRIGCWQMEGHVYVTPTLRPCTHWCFSEDNAIPLSGDWKTDFSDFVSTIDKQRALLRNGERCVCGDCPELENGLWAIDYTPKLLALTEDLKGERCNCSCVYCALTKSNGVFSNGEFSIMDVFKGLENVFSRRTQVYYASAELTISPLKKDIYAFMWERGWIFSVVKTNGIQYDNELTRFFCTETPTRVNVSLDSGTRETYRKVKGVDRFCIVNKNLQRYMDAGAKIELKYIILDNANDNTTDIDAFAEIAVNLDAQTVVTTDYYKQKIGISDNTFNMFKYFINKMKSQKLPVRLHSAHFNIADYTRVRSLLC